MLPFFPSLPFLFLALSALVIVVPILLALLPHTIGLSEGRENSSSEGSDGKDVYLSFSHTHTHTYTCAQRRGGFSALWKLTSEYFSLRSKKKL